MSATNRGAKRHKQDLYETPAYTTCALFRWFKEEGIIGDVLEEIDDPKTFWDPCAGNGAIIDAACAAGFTAPAQWIGSEIQALVPHARIRNGIDFLGMDPNDWTELDQIFVTNPPYSIANKIIEHSRRFDRWAWHMLRLNYLGSLLRSDFWRTNMPRHILVLSERPKMALNKKGKIGTDATEYAWFGWNGQEQRSTSSIEVLPPWKS